MYTGSSQFNTYSHSFLGELFSPTNALNPAANRPSRPKIITESKEREASTYFSLTGDGDLDSDQKISAQLAAQAETETVAPAPITLHPVQSAPVLCSDAPVVMSPAAMFLSAFSPPPTVTPALPDDEGQLVAGYKLGAVIGYGGFSTIRRAYSTSGGGEVAVKIVRRSDLSKQANASRAKQRLDQERRTWSTLSHEHILPLFTSVHTPYADFFVTLFCPCGSLFDILKREGRPALPQDDAGMMFRQVVRGLRYLHEVMGYVHRDMKLENVLVDESGTCKIGDFGMTRKIGEIVEEEELEVNEEAPQIGHLQRAASVSHPSTTKRTGLGGLPLHHTLLRHSGRHRTATTSTQHPIPSSIVHPGSLPYAAPELLSPLSEEYSTSLNPAQDMWALGVMLYALLTGRLPFSDSFEPRLQMKILHAVYDIPPGIGSGAERILQGCLDRCVSNRWTIAMVDEVAWGVGWGTESDRMPVPIISDEELRLQTAPSSRSRSRVAEIHVPQSPAWDHDEYRSAGSGDAATKRSASRTRRSLSRAPVLTDEGTSSRSAERSMSRSRKRLSRPTPSSFSDSSSSSLSSLHDHSPADPGVERGRRLTKAGNMSTQFASRSPSPSVLPSTPIDLTTRFRPSSPLQEDEDVDELEDPIDEGPSSRTGRTYLDRIKAPSSIRTPTGIHTPQEVDELHPDDPRHRINAITIESPPTNEQNDLYADETESSMWEQSSLILDEAEGPETFATLTATTFLHSPSPIVQSRSYGDEEKRARFIVEGWNDHPRSNQRMEFRTKQRAGSTPPAPRAPFSSEGGGVGSRRFFDAHSYQPITRQQKSRPTDDVVVGNGGLVSPLMRSVSQASARSRSLGRHDFKVQEGLILHTGG